MADISGKVSYKDDPPSEVCELVLGQTTGFTAMLKDLDDGIGLLLQELDDMGIRDNTYIIFMADNGGRETQNLERRRPAYR